MGISGAQGHLTAGGRGQGHRPPSKDAPGSAAGNFPRHKLFPGRGGAAMPSLFLKVQQALHPLLFISLPLLRPQPRPPGLAGGFWSSPCPQLCPCLPQRCGSGRQSSILRSGPSLDPPPARARLMKTGRPVPIRPGAWLSRERRGLPRALWLAPGPELRSRPTARCRRRGTGGRGSPRPAGQRRGGQRTAGTRAAAPGQRHSTAVPGALPTTLAPRIAAGTAPGCSPNPRRPRQHLDHLASSIALTCALERGTQGCWVPRTRVSPPPRCFPASLRIPGAGKESAAAGAGRSCLCRWRAPGVSDSRAPPRRGTPAPQGTS